MAFLDRFRTQTKAHIPRLDTGEYATSATRGYNTKTQQIDANVNVVATAIDTIAESCSSAQVILKKKQGKNTVILEEHPILDLLRSPNAYTSGEQLTQLHFTYMSLVGESYILKIGDGKLPDALLTLPAHLVDFKVAKNYEDSVIKFNNKEYPIDKVIRGINPDPADPMKGRSTIKAVASSIGVDTSSKEWNAKFYENSARPNMVIEVPTTMSNDTFNRFKKEFNSNFVGTDNSGKPLIIEDGASVKQFMVSQKEMDFLNSQQFTRSEILSMFRVPEAILGQVKDSNRSNAEAAEYIFSKYTIKPRLDALADILNKYLVKPYDPTLIIEFENPVPIDNEAKLNEMQAGVNNWLTIDEVRQEVGLSQLPNKLGQVIYRPYGEVPLGTTLAVTESKALEQQKQQLEDMLKEAKSVIHKQQSIIGKTNPTYTTPEQREALGEQKISITENNVNYYEQQFKIESRKHFDEQKMLVIKAMNNYDFEKSYKKKQLDDFFIGWEALTSAYGLALIILYEDLMKVQGASAMGLISSPTVFDYEDPDVVKFYESRSELISKIVDEETEKQLRAELAEGLRNNENTNEISARMERVFGSAIDYRALRISRTESIRTANQADVEAWKQSGYVTGKEFYTAKDVRVCPYCQSMDGKTIGLTDNYFEKGESLTVSVEKKDGGVKDQTMKFDFEEISSPPLHANCRCGLIPITRGT